MSEGGVERVARDRDPALDPEDRELQGTEGFDGVARNRGLVLAPECLGPKS